MSVTILGCTQLGGEPRLVEEHAHEVGIVGVLGAQPLERHVLHDTAGAASARQVDVGHAARAEPAEQGVRADHGAGVDEAAEALGEHEGADDAGKAAK